MAAPFPQLLQELGFVLLEHIGDGLFSPLSPAPAWLIELWGLTGDGDAKIAVAERSPFLENFLFEADAFWNSHRSGLCQSEPWIEKSPLGKEMPLQAIALQLEGKRFLALHSPEPQFRERSQLLQTARTSLLEHERLQREIQKKEILLHCIVHDLSQPLSVMSVAFDSMSDESVSDRGKGFLELGRKASDQQLSMIRDILQVFSADLKASLDVVDKVSSAPDLLICAKSVLESFTPVFGAKKVRLQLDTPVDAQLSWAVRGEATRIERIFSNLLENALRYSPAGSQVTIRLAQDGEFLRACVDDEGPGLPADLSPAQIFALFSKGKEGSGKAGLGLYFCRLTVERWGGAIGCASLPQQGSRFWFRLPKASVKSLTAPKDAKPPSVKTGHASSGGKEISTAGTAEKNPMRVLLADDQSEIRMLTTYQLERSGHHVVAVANGKEALDALNRESFDIVLLDEDMPVLSGLETLRHIRERGKDLGPKLVIALTGYNSDPDRERLLLAGFDSVIGKPFRLDALDALLRGSHDDAPVRVEHDDPAQSPWSNVLERVDGDEKLAGKMIATFLRDTPQRMTGIQKALNRKYAQGVASLAHALKGSVAIFGATLARECCEKLQEQGRANDLRESASIYKQLKEEIAKLEANLRGYAGKKRSLSPGASPRIKRRSSHPKRSS